MALMPPGLLDVVAAVGAAQADGTTHWLGTAFLYNGVLAENADGSSSVRGYLVTNRHVVEAADELTFLLNPRGLPPVRLGVARFGTNGDPLWVFHPDASVDVAVTGVLHAHLKNHGIVQQLAPLMSTQSFPVRRMRELEIVEGDPVFIAGFPLGIVSEPRARPIVRAGCVARVQDVYERGGSAFLVDAQAFPGNSGGPVFLVPSLISVTERPPHGTGGLLGIVFGYAPYEDIAVSPQTGQPRVVFQENSGIALVHTVDCIEETIDAMQSAS